MILYSLVYLTVNYMYMFMNMNSLGYLGVFYLTIMNLFYCSLLMFWKIYMLWLYNYSEEFIMMNWIDLSNNMNIFWGMKENTMNNIFAFMMIFGATMVSTFVFFEMNNDKEGQNFMIVLGYFMIFMLMVMGSNNLIFFYLGWEGMSLTSYFLMNFWSESVSSLKAVMKMFMISKVGDFFIIIFMCLIMKLYGTLNFDELQSIYLFTFNNKFMIGSLKINSNELLGMILLFGTCVKSAQYGFHIWLLEAMEAPLGASALMHSSTLVMAGVILLYKLSFMMEGSTYAQLLMYFMGLMSATMGSIIACFQFELKVMLAYSTMSNMGYIFILFSVGAYYEMLMILILHAFMKMYMFLVIGGMMYQNNGSQDLSWMGNLLMYNPFLWMNYVVGGTCLIGLPYFSGYYYKFYLLNTLLNSNSFLKGGEFFLLISYFFTIFYVTSMGYLIFLTNKNGHKNMYKNKKNSIFYIMSLLILSFFIIFFHFFWMNLLTMNISNMNNSMLSNSNQNYLYILNELSYFSSYLWIVMYLTIFFFFFLMVVMNLNWNWNFLKNWFFILNIFMCMYMFIIM